MPPEILEHISPIPHPNVIEAAVNQGNRAVELQQFSAAARQTLETIPAFHFRGADGSEVHFNIADVSKVQAILQNPALELSKAITHVESEFDNEGSVYSAVTTSKSFEELRGLIGDSLEKPHQQLGIDRYKLLVKEAVNLSGRLFMATESSVETNPENRYLAPTEAGAIIDSLDNLSAEQFNQSEHADKIAPSIGHTAIVAAKDYRIAA